MHREVSRLLLYGDPGADSILFRLAEICEDWSAGRGSKALLVRRVYDQVRRLLDLAARCGFDHNLWQDYLAFLLMTSENPFSLACERAGAGDGSVNAFAKADFDIFRRLFHYDFGPLERDLGIDCFSVLTHYQAAPGLARRYCRHVSAAVRRLSEAIAAAPDADAVFALVTDHYRRAGVGQLGLNHAFRVREADGDIAFEAIHNLDAVTLDDLIGCDSQKARLRANVSAFVEGRGCNNMLLYGDAGSGKSTSMKAVLNEYADRGLRMIELNKHQFGLLDGVVSRIKTRNYRFLVFIDDLSFEEHEAEYKFLKAAIEGGLESRPGNVLICATSNRRHLVKETWDDRRDMEHSGDVHRSDTLEEKLSLAARFGCAINYPNPDRKRYHDIVAGLARRAGVDLDEDELFPLADRWALRHGGMSGRTAQQFIDDLRGRS